MVAIMDGGEIDEKDSYDRDTYKYCDGDIVGASDIVIYRTQFDVANVKWGGDWRMPSLDEVKELIDNCKYEYITLNGVEGGRFIAPNGNSIFLPSAGCYHNRYLWFDMLDQRGAGGEYWTGDLYGNDDDEAFYLNFYKFNGTTKVDFLWDKRWFGRQVRPVKSR